MTAPTLTLRTDAADPSLPPPALMDLQALGSGSLLICCDVRASANPATNVSLWGRATNSAATNGTYHARATPQPGRSTFA